MSKSNSFTFKFLLVGDGGVGKTSIVQRLCHDDFSEITEQTVGVEFLPYSLNVDDNLIKLQIWDTAGQEQYKALGKTYYRNAVGVMLVFSLDQEDSFQHVNEWLDEVRSACNPNAEILLIGNKVDLVEQRQVTQAQINEFTDVNCLPPCLEVSAKNNSNIKEAFNILSRNIYRKVITNEIKLQTNNQQLVPDKSKKSCC